MHVGVLAVLVLMAAPLPGCFGVDLPPDGDPEEPGRLMGGTLYDGETGSPLAAAYIEATLPGDAGLTLLGVSDVNGRYEVSVPENATSVSFWMPCYRRVDRAPAAQGATDVSLRPVRTTKFEWPGEQEVYRVRGKALRLADSTPLFPLCVALRPIEPNVPPEAALYGYLSRDGALDFQWPKWYPLQIDFLHGWCKSSSATFEWEWEPPPPGTNTTAPPVGGEGGPRNVAPPAPERTTGPGPGLWGSGTPPEHTLFPRNVQLDCAGEPGRTSSGGGTTSPPTAGCSVTYGPLLVSVDASTRGIASIIVDGVHRGTNSFSDNRFPAGTHEVRIDYERASQQDERIPFTHVACKPTQIKR